MANESTVGFRVFTQIQRPPAEVLALFENVESTHVSDAMHRFYGMDLNIRPVSPEMRAVGPALPPGAATWTARSIAYFRGNAVATPTLVLTLWAAVGTIITLLFSSFRRPDEIDALVRRGGTPLPVTASSAPDSTSYVRTERLSEG